MGNNPTCPKPRWIRIAICSQGPECFTCEYYSKSEESNDAPDSGFPRGWVKTTKNAKKSPKPQGKISEAGKAVIRNENHSLTVLYAPAMYVDEEISTDSVSMYIAQDILAPSKDHQPHALVYSEIWSEDWS